MADVFEDRLKASLEALQREARDQVKVEADHCFIGLDAYQKVIDSGVDVVLLATPPGFRAGHSKRRWRRENIFFARNRRRPTRRACARCWNRSGRPKQKNLALVAGFCWRYHLPDRALFERIHGGEIGKVRVVYGTYLRVRSGPCRPPANGRRAWAIWSGSAALV